MSQIQINENVASFKNIFLNRGNRNSDKSVPGSIGDILEAVITGKDGDKLKVKAGSFAFESEMVKGEPGDKVYFRIEAAADSSVTLKQIFDKQRESSKLSNEISKGISTKEMADMFKKHGVYADAETNSENDTVNLLDEEQMKAMKAIQKINRRIGEFTGNTAQKAVQELIAAGISLENIQFNVLSSVMKEIEDSSAPVISGSEILKITDSKARESIDRYELINQELQENGIKTDSSQIHSVEEALNRWKEAQPVSDEAIVDLLKKNRDITIDNVYKARFAASGNMPEMQQEPELDSLIENFLTKAGFDVNDENIALSKLLIQNEVPLNSDSLSKGIFLKNCEAVDDEKVIASICRAMMSGNAGNAGSVGSACSAGSADMYEDMAAQRQEELYAEYRDIIRELPAVSENRIQSLLFTNTAVNLYGLTRHEGKAPDELVTNEARRVKSRILEIQAKLTSEASLRLANRNINISVMPVQKALEALRRNEEAMYTESLKAAGEKATERNVQELAGIFNKVQGLGHLHSAVYGGIINRDVDFTINSIHAKSISQAYEASETKFSYEYGDRRSHVDDKFGELLEKLGIEPTEENIRGAKILSGNEIDVTYENLQKVINIDVKINGLMDRLHPFIASSMIKDGLNVLDMHIDRVLTYIDSFEDKYGSGLKDKIARHIVEMEDKNQLENRDEVISIYKLLNSVLKNNALSIGALVKADLEPTLGNLLNNADIINNKMSINQAIDDEEEIKERSLVGIREILNRNLMSDTEENLLAAEFLTNRELLKYDHNNLQLREIVNKASASAINKLIEQHPDLWDKPFEEINGLLDESSISPVPQSVINGLMEEPNLAQIIHWMDTNGIPANTINTLTASRLMKNSRYVSDSINENSIQDEVEELKDFKDPETDSVQRMREILENTDLSQGDKLEQLKNIRAALSVQDAIHNRDGNKYYQMPITVSIGSHEKIGSANMYIINDNLDDNLKLYLDLDTESYGNVSMYIKIQQDTASIKICAETPEAMEKLKSRRSDLEGLTERAGYKPELYFDTEKCRNLLSEEILGTPSIENDGSFDFAV